VFKGDSKEEDVLDMLLESGFALRRVKSKKRVDRSKKHFIEEVEAH